MCNLLYNVLVVTKQYVIHKQPSAFVNYNLYTKVQSVLEDLEREYTRDEDLCGGGNSDRTSPLVSDADIAKHINRHQDQKESFLRACTMARRNAESFLKYLKKCNAYSALQGTNMADRTRGPEGYVKSESICGLDLI